MIHDIAKALRDILPHYKEFVDECGHDPAVGIDCSADFDRIAAAEKALAEHKAGAVRIYVLKTDDETTFYATEYERDAMSAAAKSNNKTVRAQNIDIEPTAEGISRTLNLMFEGR